MPSRMDIFNGGSELWKTNVAEIASGISRTAENGFVVVRMPTSIALKQNMDMDVKNFSKGSLEVTVIEKGRNYYDYT